jgi:hypothetical protein
LDTWMNAPSLMQERRAHAMLAIGGWLGVEGWCCY